VTLPTPTRERTAETRSSDRPAALAGPTRLPTWAVVGGGLAVLAAAWALVYLSDVLDVWGIRDEYPAWFHLFNIGPVEWMAWVFLAFATFSAGYLAGTLRTPSLEGARRFWVLISIAAGLMLVEEAGDVRHGMRDQLQLAVGEEVGGISMRVVFDVPFFTLLAAIPIYALLRYGRHAWASPPTRPHLVAAYLFFGMGGLANASRHIGEWYMTVGAWIERVIGRGTLPVPEETGEGEWFYFQLMDGPVEETFEFLGAVFLLAMSIAFARWMVTTVASDRTDDPRRSAPAGATARVPRPERADPTPPEDRPDRAPRDREAP
jgi:hypothetical protein